MNSSRHIALIFLVTFAVFYASPVRWLADSRHALLLSESILRHGTVALETYFPAPPEPASPGEAWNDIPGVRFASGHLRYWFPPGGSLLAMPFVALFNAAGFHVIDPDGHYDGAMELALQRFLAALLMAGLCATWMSIAGRFLPQSSAFAVAAAIAFATPVWSTASRVLWPDTWGIFLLSLALWCATRNAPASRAQTVAVAILLAFLPVVKPTYAMSSAALAVYWMATRPRSWRVFAGIAVAGGIAAVLALVASRGVISPYYRISRLHAEKFLPALAGILFSPGRGLFVYMPVLLWVLWLLARFRRELPGRMLILVAVCVVAADVAVVACFPRWWGGQCYGPRLLIGTLPWFFLIGIQSIAAAGSRARAGIGLVLVLLGALLHGRAALSNGPSRWNVEPVSVDARPGRLWDWRVPPFLADLVPDRLLPAAPLYMTAEGARTFLGQGWSAFGDNLPVAPSILREGGVRIGKDAARAWRWTDGTNAVLRLHAVDVAGRRLCLTAIPFIVAGKLDEQRVEVFMNGACVYRAALRTGSVERVQFAAPTDVGRGIVQLELHVPDAARPADVSGGSDTRRLGLMVLKIEAR